MASGEIEIVPGRVLGEEELITNQKLNDLGVPTLRIKELTITAREVEDGSITADKLDVDLEAQIGVPDNSVTTAKIVDGAVTTPKLAEGLTLRSPLINPVTSGGNYRPAGVLASFPYYGNVGVAEQDVWVYNVPAGLFARNGDAIRITSQISPSTTVAGNKNFRWKFGGTIAFLITSGAITQTFFFVSLLIARESVSAQRAIGSLSTSAGGNDVQCVALTADLAQSVELKLTMNGAAGIANDGMRHWASVLEFIPVP